MEVICDSLLAGAQAARGLAVIIDVFRAFTCTPLLFSLGIEKSILVSSPEEAFALKKDDNNLILIGEVGGVPIKGFDMGNSPSEILAKETSFFDGKSTVQRTSSGVQGAIAALDVADEVLVASYTVAKATARYILSRRPERVSVVATGWELKERAPEDEWCALYISHLLGSGNYDHNEALRTIIFHRVTQRFLRAEVPYFPAEDPILCLQRDIHDFALRAVRDRNLVVVRKVQTERLLPPTTLEYSSKSSDTKRPLTVHRTRGEKGNE
ncbi:MAG: 2-phosphosulfolactate phosphatase [Desulfobacteraceae bacterium]|jgi:2-phosphosulfolactate phosphatase